MMRANLLHRIPRSFIKFPRSIIFHNRFSRILMSVPHVFPKFDEVEDDTIESILAVNVSWEESS